MLMNEYLLVPNKIQFAPLVFNLYVKSLNKQRNLIHSKNGKVTLNRKKIQRSSDPLCKESEGFNYHKEQRRNCQNIDLLLNYEYIL